MSEILVRQVELLRTVGRAEENFRKYGRNNYTAARIRSRISTLKEIWHQCIQGHHALVITVPDKDKEAIPYFQQREFDVYEERYQVTLDLMYEWLESLEPVVSQGPPVAEARSAFPADRAAALSVQHLPPIKLPPFSGEFSEWESFRDRFTAVIINNKDLSDYSRMHFLASSLTGPARDAVASIAITASNFVVAWNALKNRYENKRKLIEVHVDSLYNLPTVTRESASDLHSLRDRAEKSVAALRSLGRSESDIFNDFLVYFVSRKLDDSTRRAWKLKSNADPSPPNYADLIAFLSNRALVLDELSPQGARTRAARAHAMTASRSPDVRCPMCRRDHYLSRCPAFLGKSPGERRSIVRRHSRCFNCLSHSHSSDSCYSKHSCKHCQQRHHSLLHNHSASFSLRDERSQEPNTASANAAAATAPTCGCERGEPRAGAVSMSSVAVSVEPAPVLLATARVSVASPSGRRQIVRALVDQGSEVTLVSERLAQGLRLSRSRTFTRISAVGGVNVSTCRHTAAIEVCPRDRVGPVFSVTAFILPSLTQYRPRVLGGLAELSYLRGLSLADDDPASSAPIDLLIGADLHSRIILDGIRRAAPDQPVAQNSHFGWLLSGPVVARDPGCHTVHVHQCSLERELRRFWEIEEIPAPHFPSVDDQKCEQHFAATHSRMPDGRYVVRLPFRGDPPLDIGASRPIAEKRLFQLTRRLSASEDLKIEYNSFLREYEALKHMARVSAPSPSATQIVYIPHHAVIRDTSSTTKLRVVFNASSSTANGTTLNSYLHAGPKLQTELSDVLLKWRQYKYVYSADIAKMYRQILVDPRDRDYQRILWYDGDYRAVQDYQLTTVTYGTACAPFLALRVLQQLLSDDGDGFPLAIPILTSNIYVDDVLFGAETIPSLKDARDQVRELLARGGFQLRKWASNESTLLTDISAEDHGLACSKVLRADDSLTILGISWSPASDSFQFRIGLSDDLPMTKRQVLSAIARLFDPLGWVTPVTVTAKVLMQTMWRCKAGWDDPLPPTLIQHWSAVYRGFSSLAGVQVPRWTGYRSGVSGVEFHGFADASTAAYAAVIYLRIVPDGGQTTIRLIMAKSRVAPLRPLSVPRLELAAGVLLARLLEYARDSLGLRFAPAYCWTDSTVALAWIKSHPSRWKTFVANRVADIQTRLPDATWRHVPTQQNPADCASRGLLGPQLPSFHLWWNGPQWLTSDSAEWPSPPSHDLATRLEEAPQKFTHANAYHEPWGLSTRFSSWSKLIRVTAYAQRFINNCRRKNPTYSSVSTLNTVALTAAEYQRARGFWIRYIQRIMFAPEIAHLRAGRVESLGIALAPLTPFLDADDILRVGGRLANSGLSFERKHPAILAAHPIVDLIVRYTHVRMCHAGVQLTLATLRQEFWLLRGRNIVKRIIHQCIPCVRERAAISTQLMGQLPAARASPPRRAFEHCGLDYAGPVCLRAPVGRRSKTYKGYIALFVCLASRAIHLEVVSSYAATAFLDAFSRFCSRRGLPGAMYSDNGTTFVGAERELTRAYRTALRDPTFLAKTAEDNISWKFIPPHAPHFGGLWEAGVKSVKHHLRRVVGAHTLTYEELTTVLCQIEACLNSRPIAPLHDDPGNYETLTPGHFLIGSPISALPQPSLLSLNQSRLSRWQLIRQLSEGFWRRWQSDYINTLQQKLKWKKVTPAIRMGTMVILKNPLLPPCKWELGRVTRVHPGSDGLTRVATVRTAHSEYKRPIVKLCILPINEDERPESSNPCDTTARESRKLISPRNVAPQSAR